MKRLKNSNFYNNDEYMIIENEYIENDKIYEVLKNTNEVSQFDRFINEYNAFNHHFEIYYNFMDCTIEIYCTDLNLWVTDIKLKTYKKLDTYALIENSFGLFLLRNDEFDYEDFDFNDECNFDE